MIERWDFRLQVRSATDLSNTLFKDVYELIDVSNDVISMIIRISVT